jgi:hypothetical protein
MSPTFLRTALGSAFFLIAAVAACSSPTATTDAAAGPALALSQSELQGQSLESLRGANWDCQQRGPTFISCAPPGIGLPPIPPLGVDGRPAYQIAVFALDGTPIGTAHFIRADLYNGRTCGFTGAPYVFRAIIGYYECLNAF